MRVWARVRVRVRVRFGLGSGSGSGLWVAGPVEHLAFHPYGDVHAWVAKARRAFRGVRGEAHVPPPRCGGLVRVRFRVRVRVRV